MMFLQAAGKDQEEIGDLDVVESSRLGALDEGGRDMIQRVKGGIETNRFSVQSLRRDPPEEEKLLVGDAPRSPEADSLGPMSASDGVKPFNHVDKRLFPLGPHHCPIQPDGRRIEAFGATEMLEACPAPHAEGAPRDGMAGRGHDPDGLSPVYQEVEATTGATVGTDGEDALQLYTPRRKKLCHRCLDVMGSGTSPAFSYLRPPGISTGICAMSPRPYHRGGRPHGLHHLPR